MIFSPRIGIAAAGAEHHQVVEAADLDLVLGRTEHAADDVGDLGEPALRRFLQLLVRHQLGEDALDRELAVAERGEDLLRFRVSVLRQERGEQRAVGQPLQVDPVAARLLLEHLLPEIEAARLLLGVDVVLDLVARARGDREVQPVAARMVPGRRDHLDDVAVAQARPERHHLPVDARAGALVPDVGVDRRRRNPPASRRAAAPSPRRRA